MLFYLLGAGVAGWLAGESFRRGRRLGDQSLGRGHSLGQGQYGELVNDLLRAKAEYERTISQDGRYRNLAVLEATAAFRNYRKAYEEYQRAMELARELEPIFRNYENTFYDLHLDPGGRAPGINEALKERMKEYLSEMERLWPGWYEGRREWDKFERTGGKPDWYLDLEKKGQAAVGLALSLLPLAQGVRGGVRFPGGRPSVPTIRVSTGARPQPGIVIQTGPQPVYPFRPGDVLRKPLIPTAPSVATSAAVKIPMGTPESLWQRPPAGIKMPMGLRARVDVKTGEVFYHVYDIEKAMRGELPSVTTPYGPLYPPTNPAYTECANPWWQRLYEETYGKPMYPSPGGPAPVYPVPWKRGVPQPVPEAPLGPIPPSTERRWEWIEPPQSRVGPRGTRTEETARIPTSTAPARPSVTVPFVPPGAGMAIPFPGV